MNIKIITGIILIANLASFDVALAVCQRAHVCNDYGQNCKYMDVCDSNLDLPAIGLNPMPSIRTLEPKPLPSLALPPLGANKCEYAQVNGRWQNICR